MAREPAIEISSLWKLFQIRRQATASGNGVDHALPTDADEAAVSQGRAFWALRDINLSITRGEVVGLIGANGAGKSTLLKVLSQVVAPTRGQVRIHGTVASLLELGAGFHDELTGRENIALNATILGMSRRDLDRCFDDIVAFSGIGDFIEMPAKYLSSGMRVRLGFSVAVHVEPEILVIDEILAVGDADFQERCRKRIAEMIRSDHRTVLIASHSLSSIRSLCSRVIHLEHGCIVADGPSRQTTNGYLARLAPSAKSPPAAKRAKADAANPPQRPRPVMDANNCFNLNQRSDRTGDGRLRFTSVSLRGLNGERVRSIGAGQGVTFELPYVADQSIVGWRDCYLNVGIINERGHRLCVAPSHVVGQSGLVIEREGAIRCAIETMPLMPGTYSIDLVCKIEGALADKLRTAALMVVEPNDFYATGRFPAQGIAEIVLRYAWSGARSHATPQTTTQS